MSIQDALVKLQAKYFIYKRKLEQIDPSVEDQLMDAKMRGKLEAYEEIVKVLTSNE